MWYVFYPKYIMTKEWKDYVREAVVEAKKKDKNANLSTILPLAKKKRDADLAKSGGKSKVMSNKKGGRKNRKDKSKKRNAKSRKGGMSTATTLSSGEDHRMGAFQGMQQSAHFSVSLDDMFDNLNAPIRELQVPRDWPEQNTQREQLLMVFQSLHRKISDLLHQGIREGSDQQVSSEYEAAMQTFKQMKKQRDSIKERKANLPWWKFGRGGKTRKPKRKSYMSKYRKMTHKR